MPIYKLILESSLVWFVYGVLPALWILKRHYQYNLKTLYFFLLNYHEKQKTPHVLKIVKGLFYYFRILRFCYNTLFVFVAITLLPITCTYVYLFLTFVYDGQNPWTFLVEFTENFLKFYLVEYWWIVKIFLRIFFLGVVIAFYCYMKSLNFEHTKRDVRIMFFNDVDDSKSLKLKIFIGLFILVIFSALSFVLYHTWVCVIGKLYLLLYLKKSCWVILYLPLFLSKKLFAFLVFLLLHYKLKVLLILILRLYFSRYIKYYIGKYLKNIYTQGFSITVIRYTFFYINIWEMFAFYYLYCERKYFMYIQTYIDRNTLYDQEFKSGNCFTKKPTYENAKLKAFMYTEEDYKKYIYLFLLKLSIRQVYFIIYIIKYTIIYIIKYNFIIYIRMFHFHLFVNYIKLLIFTVWSSNLYIYIDYIVKELYVVFNHAIVAETYTFSQILGLFYKKSVQYYNYNYVSTRILKRTQFQEWFLGWYDISKHLPKNEKVWKFEYLGLQQFFLFLKVRFSTVISEIKKMVMFPFFLFHSLVLFLVNFYTDSIITKWVFNCSHFFFHIVGVFVINCVTIFFFVFFKFISIVFQAHVWFILFLFYISYIMFDMNNAGVSSVHYMVTMWPNPGYFLDFLNNCFLNIYVYLANGILDSVYKFRPEYKANFDITFELLCNRIMVNTWYFYMKKVQYNHVVMFIEKLQADLWFVLKTEHSSLFAVNIDWFRFYWTWSKFWEVMWIKGPIITILGTIKYEKMWPEGGDQFDIFYVYGRILHKGCNLLYHIHTRWLFSRVTHELPNVHGYREWRIYGGYIIFIGKAIQMFLSVVSILNMKLYYYWGIFYLGFLNSDFYVTWILPSYIKYVYLATDPYWNVCTINPKSLRVSFFTSTFWVMIVNHRIFELLYIHAEITAHFSWTAYFKAVTWWISQSVILVLKGIKFINGMCWSLSYIHGAHLHYSVLFDFWMDVYLKAQEYFDWITYYCRINYFNLYSWVTEASYEEIKESNYDEVAHGFRKIIKKRKFRIRKPISWHDVERFFGDRTFIARGAARTEANRFRFRFVRETIYPLEPFELFYAKSKGLIEYFYEAYGKTPVFQRELAFKMRNQTKPHIFGIRDLLQAWNTYKVLVLFLYYDYGAPLKDFNCSLNGWYLRQDYKNFLTALFFQFTKYGLFIHFFFYLVVRGIHCFFLTKNYGFNESERNPKYWWENFRTNYNYNLLSNNTYTRCLNEHTLEEMKEKLLTNKAGEVYNPETHVLNQEKSMYIRLFKNIHLKPVEYVYEGFNRFACLWGNAYYNIPRRLHVKDYFNSTRDEIISLRAYYAKAFTKLHGRNDQQQNVPSLGSFGFQPYITRYFKQQSIIRNLEKIAESLYINYWLQVESYFNLASELPAIFAKFQVASLKNFWQIYFLWHGSDYYEEDYTPLEEQLVDPGFSMPFAEAENVFMLTIYNYFKDIDFYIFNKKGPNWLYHKNAGSMFSNYDIRESYVIVDEYDLPFGGEYALLFAPIFFFFAAYFSMQQLIRPDWGQEDVPIIWNLRWFSNFYQLLILQNIKPVNWLLLQFEQFFVQINPPWVPRSLGVTTTSVKQGWREVFILDMPFVHQHNICFWLTESQAHSNMTASKANLYFINHTFFQDLNRNIYLMFLGGFAGLYLCYLLQVNIENYKDEKNLKIKRSVELQFLVTLVEFISVKVQSVTRYVNQSNSRKKRKGDV